MTEKVLVEIELEQDEGAFANLAKLKGVIVNLKEEQKKLNTAFKERVITEKEFLSESVRIEAMLKKHADSYSKLQRSVTGLKSPFDKLNQSIKEQAQQINVAGMSLSTFANPVTATVGILGSLFAAYSKTTIGAKDLEFASNQLGSAATILGNDLASLFSSAEDGEGFFSTITQGFLNYLSPSLAATSRGMALLAEELEDLAREEIKVRAANDQRLKENAELNELLADSTVSLDEKRRAAAKSVTNLRINESELLRVKEAELKILEARFAVDSKNEKLEDSVLLKAAEIEAIKKDTERSVSKIDKLESNILDTENKKLATLKKQNEERDKKQKADEMERQIKLDQKEEEEESERIQRIQDLRQVNSTASFQAWWTQRVQIAKDGNDEMERNSIAEFEREKARQEARLTFIKDLTANVTQILTAGLQSNAEIGKQILKSYLITAARMLKGWLLTKVIGESFATPDSVLTFGLTGSIRAAVMAGLIEGAFSGIESFIAGFATGGVISGQKIKQSDGKRVTRSNGDTVLITAKPNEVVLNEDQQRRLGGNKVLKAIGVPGIDSYQGFAGGGKIETGISREFANNQLSRDLIKRLGDRQVAVVIEQVELKLQQRSSIREKATL